MKLQPDIISVQSINSYGPGWIGVAGEKIRHSVIIGSGGERINWACERFEDLRPEHFAQLAEMNAELILFGSGKSLRFPHAAWVQPLIEKQIGVETMDTEAACRTYNVLASEGRRVIAALLLETTV